MSRTAKALTAIGAVVAFVLGAGVGVVLWFQHCLDRSIERFGVPFETLPERPDPAPESDSNAP